MSVTVNNPSPLNPYLFSQVQNVFGNDSTVTDAFKADLYPAYSTTQLLTPLTTGGGSYVLGIKLMRLIAATGSSLTGGCRLRRSTKSKASYPNKMSRRRALIPCTHAYEACALTRLSYAGTGKRVELYPVAYHLCPERQSS